MGLSTSTAPRRRRRAAPARPRPPSSARPRLRPRSSARAASRLARRGARAGDSRPSSPRRDSASRRSWPRGRPTSTARGTRHRRTTRRSRRSHAGSPMRCGFASRRCRPTRRAPSPPRPARGRSRTSRHARAVSPPRSARPFRRSSGATSSSSSTTCTSSSASPGALQVLESLCRQAPPRLHLVLASRDRSCRSRSSGCAGRDRSSSSRAPTWRSTLTRRRRCWPGSPATTTPSRTTSCTERPAAGPPRCASRPKRFEVSPPRIVRRALDRIRRPGGPLARLPRSRGLRARAARGRDADPHGRAARAIHRRALRGARRFRRRRDPPLARAPWPLRRASGPHRRLVLARTRPFASSRSPRSAGEHGSCDRSRAPPRSGSSSTESSRRRFAAWPAPATSPGWLACCRATAWRSSRVDRSTPCSSPSSSSRTSSRSPRDRAAGRRGPPGAGRLGRGPALLRPRRGRSRRAAAGPRMAHGVLRHMSGRLDEAMAAYDRAGEEGDPRDLALLLAWRASAHWLRGDGDACRADATRAFAIASDAERPAGARGGAHRPGDARRTRGRPGANDAHYLRALDTRSRPATCCSSSACGRTAARGISRKARTRRRSRSSISLSDSPTSQGSPSSGRSL